MKNHFGRGGDNRPLQRRPIEDVADNRSHSSPQSAQLEVRRARVGSQRISGDAGAHLQQPRRQPSALEAGMARDKHRPIPPERFVQLYHRRQGRREGACWVRQSSFKSCISRPPDGSPGSSRSAPLQPGFAAGTNSFPHSMTSPRPLHNRAVYHNVHEAPNGGHA